MEQTKSGYLEIILGSMYSGKTSRLVEIYKQCQFCNISVIVINHNIDNRYDDNLMSTHDQIKIPCLKTEKLIDLQNAYINSEASNNPGEIEILKVLEQGINWIMLYLMIK